MVFSRLYFLFAFFPLFFLTYYLFKKRSHRNIILFVFSLVFYAWGEPVYIFLMMASLTSDYFIGMGIGWARERDRGKLAKRLMILSMVTNLALIGVFKYSGFLVMTFNSIAGTSIHPPSPALPIGISFYTFQIMTYIIDVYKGKIQPQKNYLFLGSYLCAFPQLVAGPIVRYETIAHEIEGRRENMVDFSEGMRRFTAGLAKKVLIANTMASVCDAVLNDASPVKFGAIGMWIAVIAYTLQIYYDFSGYSDMAIGIGRMMGFHYPENFNYPYIAKSVGEFWRRWHMTLSTFFRDYVYIPLGGNRVSMPRWIFNISVVWFLTGLWHGAGWTFILWGVYFGVLLVIEKLVLSKKFLQIPVLNRVYAIAAFVFGWVIFRAESLSDVGMILRTMFGASGSGSMSNLAAAGIITPAALLMFVAGVALSIPVSRKIKAYIEEKKPSLSFLIDAGSVAALLCSAMVLAGGAYNPFIYFRF